MGVPGDPIRTQGICQIRVMMMLVVRRLHQQPGACLIGQPGKAEGQEDLAEQRGDPEPDPDAAPDAVAHRRLALPPVATRAGHVWLYSTSSAAHALPRRGAPRHLEGASI